MGTPAPIADSVRRFLERHGIGPARILAAVSGGADSTALLLALRELGRVGYEVVCGHVNHHLRGAESDGDEAFVRAMCEDLGVPFHRADGKVPEEDIRKHGLEGAARDIRITRLQELRAASGARFIATGHQKNDQAETVLMRLTSGSGPAGLRGIHPVRDDGIIRPLLNVSRSDIEAWLSARNITPRRDSSNTDPRFHRNRIRVVLGAMGSPAIDHLAGIAAQAQEQWPILESAIDDAESGSLTIEPQGTRFHSWPENAWLRHALLLRHIRRLGTSTREVSSIDLERLTAAPETIRRVSVTAELELIRRGDDLVLRRKPEPQDDFELEVQVDASVPLPAGGFIRLERCDRSRALTSEDRSRQVFQIREVAPARFLVRNRRKGDRFHPLGAPGAKKLKDFLIDRKIAPELRDRLPLLVWNDEIVWVAGVEVSNEFRVTEDCGELYEVAILDFGF